MYNIVLNIQYARSSKQALKQALYWQVSRTFAAPSGEPLPTEAQLAWRLFLLDCEFAPNADAERSAATPPPAAAAAQQPKQQSQQPQQPPASAPLQNAFRSVSRFAAANAPPPLPQATGKASRAAAGAHT